MTKVIWIRSIYFIDVHGYQKQLLILKKIKSCQSPNLILVNHELKTEFYKFYHYMKFYSAIVKPTIADRNFEH